jgi:hypothetical protein
MGKIPHHKQNPPVLHGLAAGHAGRSSQSIGFCTVDSRLVLDTVFQDVRHMYLIIDWVLNIRVLYSSTVPLGCHNP